MNKKELLEKEPISMFYLDSIIEIDGDIIIPIPIAAKIKGISGSAIYRAIQRGNIVKIDGVLGSSLVKYEVDERAKKNGDMKKEAHS